ncbi:MAG TPA: hypothetical protein VH208_13150 [Myxococcaceae bacterium]|nr:hypothetical protein [Myxococcaceae bacterium]
MARDINIRYVTRSYVPWPAGLRQGEELLLVYTEDGIETAFIACDQRSRDAALAAVKDLQYPEQWLAKHSIETKDHLPFKPEEVLLMTPVTVDGPYGLTHLVSRLFWCMDGPPRAYFGHPGGMIVAGQEYATVQHAYDTLWLGVEEGAEDGPALLAAAMWKEFQRAYRALASEGFEMPVLFWRSRPALGPGMRGSNALAIRCRLAVPGIDFGALAKEPGKDGRYLTDEEIADVRHVLAGAALAGVPSAAPQPTS